MAEGGWAALASSDQSAMADQVRRHVGHIDEHRGTWAAAYGLALSVATRSCRRTVTWKQGETWHVCWAHCRVRLAAEHRRLQ